MAKFVGTDVIPNVATLPATGSAGQIVYHTNSDQYYAWDVSDGKWYIFGQQSAAKGYGFMMGE